MFRLEQGRLILPVSFAVFLLVFLDKTIDFKATVGPPKIKVIFGRSRISSRIILKFF